MSITSNSACRSSPAFDGTRTNSSPPWTSGIGRWTSVHNQADLIIAKQRHGPTGTIQLFFEAEFTRFADLDRVHSAHVES